MKKRKKREKNIVYRHNDINVKKKRGEYCAEAMHDKTDMNNIDNHDLGREKKKSKRNRPNNCRKRFALKQMNLLI